MASERYAVYEVGTDTYVGSVPCPERALNLSVEYATSTGRRTVVWDTESGMIIPAYPYPRLIGVDALANDLVRHIRPDLS